MVFCLYLYSYVYLYFTYTCTCTRYMPVSESKTAEEVVSEVIKRGGSKKLVRTVTRMDLPETKA